MIPEGAVSHGAVLIPLFTVVLHRLISEATLQLFTGYVWQPSCVRVQVVKSKCN